MTILYNKNNTNTKLQIWTRLSLSSEMEGKKMLSTHADEILGFIRDFEVSSRDYLLSKGLSEYEMRNAYLDLQWNFLHTILKQN